MSIRDELIAKSHELTRSELKVLQVLIDTFPRGALGTMSALARSAHVSDPTVMRTAVKLGYPTFADMQQAVLNELDSSLPSPLRLLKSGSSSRFERDDIHNSFLSGVISNLEEMRGDHLPPNFRAALDLLGSKRRNIYCLGGRFSKHLAALFGIHLNQVRAGVSCLDGSSAELLDLLVDFNEHDTLAVFDYRRYQADVIAYAKAARNQGTRLLLFTDKWFSPIAKFADVTLSAPIETISPFDTLVPGLAQIEALVAVMMAQPGSQVQARLERIEALRESYTVHEGS